MKRTMMAAILMMVIVAAAGVTLRVSQSQAPPPATDDFTAIEQQLNDLEDFTNSENLASDFGIGDMAGNW